MWVAVFVIELALFLPTSSNTTIIDDATPTSVATSSSQTPRLPPKPIEAPKQRTLVHKVPPTSDAWKKLKISKEEKRYLELEWSKSTFSKECSGHILQVIPVYFWPGERVDLPCRMCELSMAYNGKVKYWAKVTNMAEFLTEPQINVMTRKDLFSVVSNEGSEGRAFEMVYNLNSSKFNVQPSFVQRNGKLSIIHANPVSQGVYFCYDDQSIGITNLFYVVQAMTPPVSIFDEHQIPEELKYMYDDYCSTRSGSIQISPAINWRFHFQPTFRDYVPKHCTAGTACADYVEMNRPKGEYEKICSFRGCRVKVRPIRMQNSQYDPGLDIELRWEDWSSCDGNVPAQRREAHCYIVAQQDFTVDENAEDIAASVSEFAWAVKLSRLVRTDALKKIGIRLYSSTVAAYLYRETVLKGCGKVQEGIRIAADEVWRRHLLRTMGVKEWSGKHIERNSYFPLSLDNPFQACLRYEKTGVNHEMIIGTYMVETRNCF